MNHSMFETNQDFVREVTKSLIQDGKPHRAGDLYERFVEQTGGIGVNGKPISRREYETRIRALVMQEDGFIKRTAFGIYQMRSSAGDRGLIVCNKPRQNAAAFAKDDPEILDDVVPQALDEHPTLEEILTDACKMTSKLKTVFEQMARSREVSLEQKRELVSIRKATLSQVHQAITGITAAMAWVEDQRVESENSLDSEDEGEYQGPSLGM